MGLRVFVFLCFIGGLAAGCKNEPYEDANLAVSGIVNHDSATSVAYKYSASRLYTFQTAKSGIVTSSMRFHYSGSQLTSITIDSTTASWKIDRFYGYGSSAVVDSTVAYTDSTAVLFSVRTVTYDENGKTITVNQKLYPATGMTEQNAQLSWEEDNVAQLLTINAGTGDTTVNVTVGHDKKNCIYRQGQDYIYTLSLQKLFWLSKNNPVQFNEKKYNFSYNKFDFPTAFRSEVNTQFGVTYTAVR